MGLERAGMETVAFCEIDPFCHKVLRKHWPKTQIFKDVKKLPTLPSIDLICGGFPCQAFSHAARGKNNAEDLWPYMVEVITRHMPKYILAENVQSWSIKKAKQDLENLGYEATIKRIGAHDAGAWHQRNRWWLCAYTDKNSELPSAIDAEAQMLPKLCEDLWGAKNYARAIRVSDGLPYRMDRIRSVGNSAMPPILEIIGRAIMEAQ